MNCPRCETDTLVSFAIEDVTVDRCSNCAGVWFDAEELSQLWNEEARHVSQLLKGVMSEQFSRKIAHCPRDGSELMRAYSAIDHAVILDFCGDCRGVWLDIGEFQKLFAATRH